jgi:hypothetical protein
MNRIYMVLLLVLGLVFTPATAFACKHHEAPKYAEATKDNTVHSCCKSAANHSHSYNKHKESNCGGCCCQCVSAGFYKFLSLVLAEASNFFVIQTGLKPLFGYAESLIAATPQALRLPPKIS